MEGYNNGAEDEEKEVQTLIDSLCELARHTLRLRESKSILDIDLMKGIDNITFLSYYFEQNDK
jgi:hypothetical protein